MYINTAQYDQANPANTTTRTSTTTMLPKTPDTFAPPRPGKQVDAFVQGGAEGYAGLMGGFNNLEAGNYQSSGYQDIFNDKTLGMVPQDTMDAYWGQATENAMNKSRGAYASVYGERGGAPSGVGSQAEMLSRRGTQLAETRAGANMENAAQGARTQAAARQTISGNRYKVLTDPVDAYYKLQQGEGARLERFGGQSGGETTTMTQTSPLSGGGVSQRPAVSGGGGGVGAAQRPQAAAPGSAPGGDSGTPYSVPGSSYQTYPEPPFGAESGYDPNMGGGYEISPTPSVPWGAGSGYDPNMGGGESRAAVEPWDGRSRNNAGEPQSPYGNILQPTTPGYGADYY